MAKWRKVRLAAGKVQIQMLNVKCRIKDCENFVRKEPGATHCDFHRDIENAGCAEHDQLDCGDCK